MFDGSMSGHSKGTEKAFYLVAWGISDALRNGEKGLARCKTAAWVRPHPNASEGVLRKPALPEELVTFVPCWVDKSCQYISKQNG